MDWKKNIKPIKFKDKSIFKKIHIFKNVKYKWGGKSFKGIDCSGLVQIVLNFNNKVCPRDAKDQNIFFKGKIKIKNIKKNNLIFWKGHVAIALSNKELIHAYGPEKKTLVMNINKTLERIEKTAKLNVIGVRRVWSRGGFSLPPPPHLSIYKIRSLSLRLFLVVCG